MAKNIILPNATIAVLNAFANEQREGSVGWLKAKGMSQDDAEDLFQEAFITLFQQQSRPHRTDSAGVSSAETVDAGISAQKVVDASLLKYETVIRGSQKAEIIGSRGCSGSRKERERFFKELLR